MPEYIQVVTTTETREQALTIAREAVRARDAACAQVLGPMTSIFQWEGSVEEAEEHLCVMKTRADAFEALERTIRAVHPYAVPEILALPISTGGADYLAWMRDEVTVPKKGPPYPEKPDQGPGTH